MLKHLAIAQEIESRQIIVSSGGHDIFTEFREPYEVSLTFNHLGAKLEADTSNGYFRREEVDFEDAQLVFDCLVTMIIQSQSRAEQAVA